MYFKSCISHVFSVKGSRVAYWVWYSLSMLVACHCLSATESTRSILFQNDLQALYMCLLNNHPASFTASDTFFPWWLELGHRAAVRQSEHIETDADHLYALSFFVKGFCDPHVCVHPTMPLEVQWTGWCVAYRAGRYEVFVSEVDEVAVGDELIAYDGMPVSAWFDRYILSYKGIRSQACAVQQYAWLLGAWEGSSLVPQPTSYQFVSPDGVHKTVMPTWRVVPAHRVLQHYKPQHECGIQPFYDGVWIHLPTFSPTQEERSTLAHIAATIKNYRSCPYIIFDLRGNSGGSTWYADAILQKLFGTRYFYARQDAYAPHAQILWRASDYTCSYVCSLAQELVQTYGADHEISRWIMGIQKGMQQAWEQQQPFFQELYKQERDYDAPCSRKYTGTVIVIIDGWCVSAALDMIDAVYMVHDDIVLVGQPTQADSPYTESCDVVLPSGKAVLTFPIKLYRTSLREPYTGYTPDYYCTQIYHEPAVQDAVLEAVGYRP